MPFFGSSGCPLIAGKVAGKEYIQTRVIWHPNTCVSKSISKKIQYLDKCLLTSSIIACEQALSCGVRESLLAGYQYYSNHSLQLTLMFTTHSQAQLKEIFLDRSLLISENINNPLIFVLSVWKPRWNTRPRSWNITNQLEFTIIRLLLSIIFLLIMFVWKSLMAILFQTVIIIHNSA